MQKFINNCYEINCSLLRYNLFLRVFELKSKFRYLTLKKLKKTKHSQKIIKLHNRKVQLLFNSQVKLEKKFKPIDIIYKPTINPEKKATLLLQCKYF